MSRRYFFFLVCVLKHHTMNTYGEVQLKFHEMLFSAPDGDTLIQLPKLWPPPIPILQQ